MLPMESLTPPLGALERELGDYGGVDHRSNVIRNGAWGKE